MRNVTIMGAGYVGLPTAAHWASQHNVVVYDPDESKISAVKSCIENDGELYIHEKGLKEAIVKYQEKITLTSDFNKAIENPDFIFIAVGTPPNSKGRANLSYIASAAEQIGKTINKDCIIINKSTVPPGTAYLVENKINEELKKRNVSYKINVGSCPEFLAEGTAMQDLRVPDRIVFGCDDKESLEKIEEFFKFLHQEDHKFVPMKTVSSELTKYAANSMLAARISFMNELAILCDHIGADVKEVEKGIGLDSRIGKKFLKAGFGFGGSCFGKDTNAINNYAKLLNFNLGVIDSAIEANKNVPAHFLNKINAHYGDNDNNLEGKNFLIWGIGFKAGTDDLRDSKAVELIKSIISKGAFVYIFDDVSMALTNFKNENPDLQNYEILDNQYNISFENIDGLIIGNEASPFRSPDTNKIKYLRNKVVFDGKNCVSHPAIIDLKSEGIIYKSMGKDCEHNDIDKDMLIHFLQEEYMQ